MDVVLSNATNLVADSAAESSHEPSVLGQAIYIALVFVILFALMAVAKKGFTSRVFTNRISWLFEQVYLFIQNLCIGTIGPHGKKYVPMMMTLWLVIFLSNILGLFLSETPTANLSFNFGMAVLTIVYVQFEGIKTNGFIGHISHFAGPRLPLAMIPITGMLFLIEIVSEVMKNLSLSLRLFANIHGGHEAVTAIYNLGWMYFIPIGAFLLPIKILACVVQALIFCTLTCVYLSLVTHHEDHSDGGHLAHAH